MAHKTFISYKFSEAKDLRDRIIEALGDDAIYYQGETSSSPDLTDYATETIKAKLKDMIHGTSVTIVVLSPNMKASRWIEWEIKYSLRSTTRKDRTSHRNGVVAVIQKDNGSYEWFRYFKNADDGCKVCYHYDYKTFDVIRKNTFNQNPPIYSCDKCKCVSLLTGCYITYVTEDEFLSRPDFYIENAFSKSQNNASGYDLCIEK